MDWLAQQVHSFLLHLHNLTPIAAPILPLLSEETLRLTRRMTSPSDRTPSPSQRRRSQRVHEEPRNPMDANWGMHGAQGMKVHTL